MRRREFIKAVGLGAAAWAIPAYITASERSGQAVSGERILGEADARIQKCRMGDALLRFLGPDGKPLKSGLAVKIEQKQHKFLFGCNIFKLNRCRTTEDNTAYAERFDRLLNFATLSFYWWSYERQRGRPDDARTEEIVRWCNAHNITTKGHPLAWNYAQPHWLPKDTDSAMQLQFKRIERCVRRFENEIDIWDVVNEATHYDRTECKERAPVLTEAIRKMGVGAYVREAFKSARKANPKATLLINDYRTDPSYAEKVISELVDDSGQSLYDVIGIQSHMHGSYWGAHRAWEVCERFAKFGKPLHFTETTVVSGPRKKSGWTTTPDGEKRQARQVAEFYRVLFSHPAVEAVTWWDFTDQNAWQRAPAGLVRDDMSPKPAYEELERLIKGKWWTQTETAVAAGGNTSFRGYLGQYEVSTRIEAQKLTGTFRLDKTTKQTIDVQLKSISL